MVSTVARGIMSRLLGCILFSVSFHAILISLLCGETETMYLGSGRRINPFSSVSYLWFRGWGCILSCLLSKRYCTVSHVCLVPIYTGFLRIFRSVLYVPIL